jgi:hypothetical protein
MAMTDSTSDSNQFSKPQYQILRTDVLGRVRTPPDLREVLLDEFEQSALSGAQFAKTRGLKYQTFATWVQKRKKACGEYPAATCGGPTSPDQDGRSCSAPRKKPSSANRPKRPNCLQNQEKSFTFLEVTPEPLPVYPSPNHGDFLLIELGHQMKIQVQNDQHISLAAKLIKSLL